MVQAEAECVHTETPTHVIPSILSRNKFLPRPHAIYVHS